MQESFKVKAKARRAFTYALAYAPGDDFEGTEEQVQALCAQGNLDITTVTGEKNPEFTAEVDKAKKAQSSTASAAPVKK